MEPAIRPCRDFRAEPEEEESRERPRTTLFLAAVLRFPSGQIPVRIRNMSQSGAMVEAPALPLPGTPIELERGRLRVRGTMAWSVAGRGGLALQAAINVREWMAPIGSPGQQTVDQVVRAVRRGDPPPSWPSAPPPPAARSSSLAGDLRLAIGLLEQLGDALALDPATVEQFGRELQNLDLCQQLLEALASVDEGKPPHGARLEDLRSTVRSALRP